MASAAGGAAAPELVEHAGACHCGAVTFAFTAPRDLLAWDCNCSVCAMKRNVHCMAQKSAFRLLSGEDQLTEYRFNTRRAVHMFCKVCGVQAFYSPRSNPDSFAVTIACIRPGTVASFTIKAFDGRNWEAFYGKSGIAALSKGAAADVLAADAADAAAKASSGGAAAAAGGACAAAEGGVGAP
jgi:hypothetical protein